MKVQIFKLRRCLRKVPSAAARRFIEPIFNAGQILTFAAAVIGLALYLRTATPEQRDVKASEWAIAIEAFTLALAGWAAISVLVAPFLVIRDDRRRGSWHGNRYVYREPMLIKTLRCRATGEIEMYKFRVLDVEPGSFVYYSVDIDGPGHLAEISVGGTILVGPFPYSNWPGTGGTDLPTSNHMIFRIRMPVQANSATIRIYCHGFIVGEPNDQDGSVGNYQFPARA